MTSTKLFTALTSLRNGSTQESQETLRDTSSTLKQEKLLPYPTHSNDCDIEGIFEPTEDYIKWRESLPVGYLLDRQLERNKKNIIGIDDLEIYEYEKNHIANPIDYYCTRPDVIIRWKL